MTILTIRTDKPESEIGIFNGAKKLHYYKWPAHRQLSVTLHKKIKELLEKNKLAIQNIEGIVVYAGPGSFTGLRIGISVANALSYGLNVPIIAKGGRNWQKAGVGLLEEGQNHIQAAPVYGGDIHLTKPAK